MTAVTSEDRKEFSLDRILRDASDEDRITLTQGKQPSNLVMFRITSVGNCALEDIVDRARNRYLSPTWFQKVLDYERVVEPLHAWQVASCLGLTSQSMAGRRGDIFKCQWVDAETRSRRSLGKEILREYPTQGLLNQKRAQVLVASNHGLDLPEIKSIDEAWSYWRHGLMERGLSDHRVEVVMLDEYEDCLETLHRNELFRGHLSQIDRTLARWGEIPYRKVKVTVEATLIDHTGVEWGPDKIEKLVDDCLCETFSESLIGEMGIETRSEKLVGGVK